MILTDGRYEVLTLLRSHRDDARGLATMPRHPYPLHSIRLATPVTTEGWAAALAAADPDKMMLRGSLTKTLVGCNTHIFALKRELSTAKQPVPAAYHPPCGASGAAADAKRATLRGE